MAIDLCLLCSEVDCEQVAPGAIGGKKTQINFGTRLSAAELVSAQDVLNRGKQQLTLSSNGSASGGAFVLYSSTLESAIGTSLNSLVISRGATD